MDVPLKKKTNPPPPKKQPYEPPRALFVPLKIEERLMSNCTKMAMFCHSANRS